MSSNNNSNREQEADIRQELKVTTLLIREMKTVMHERTRRVRPPAFRDLNPVAQLMPQVCTEFSENGLAMDPVESRPSICLPDDYCRFNSAETSTLLSLLLDSNHTRMTRLLNQVHIRAMLREDRYYQIVDDPALYFRSKCTDLPAFHNRVVLYLTTPGVLTYLKQTDALSLFSHVGSQGVLPRTPKMEMRREARQSERRQPQADFDAVLDYERRKANEVTPFFNVYAFQYATYVHCYEGDILRFQLDYLAVKRHYQEALPILMVMGWQPNGQSTLLYRRRYYQYMTPFLDWVDMVRYQIKTSPTISLAGFYEKLLDTNSEHVDLDDLRYLGHTMLECFELRRLSKMNCSDSSLHGLYAGRKVHRDRDPRGNSQLKKVFGKGSTVRPVLPHACSPLRRFLVHLNYYDRQSMTSLPQMLALVDFMLQQDFFTMHPLCRVSDIRFEPLVFQIYDFVWSIRQGRNVRQKVYLRNETWEAIRTSEDAFAWYRRWDVFNCICILLGVCQNAVERDMDEQLVDRLVRLIIDVLRSSEFLESFVSYSYFDTYLGVSCAVNCVPNLSISCLLRVLRTVPFHLASSLTVGQFLNTFSERFWRTGPSTAPGEALERPRTLRQIGEFLMTRSRRISVKQAPLSAGENSDAVSGMSAMGSAGAVVILYRNFRSMPTVSPEDESAAVNDDILDASRRVDAERQHLADYRQKETDFRYGQIFTDSYSLATGRPRIFYDENLSYQDCKFLSMAQYSHQDG